MSKAWTYLRPYRKRAQPVRRCNHDGQHFDFNPGEFDAVTVCHVVEHITDLAAFLSRLRTLVSPRGFVYIEVPNAGDFERFADPQSVAESIYIRDLFTHFTPEHVNFFSVVSLRNLMRRYGFDEVACTGTPLGAIASVWRRSRVDQDTDTAGAVARYAEHSHELQRGRSREFGTSRQAGRRSSSGAPDYTRSVCLRTGLWPVCRSCLCG